MKFSYAALVAALGVSSVTATCSSSGFVEKIIDFNTDKDGNPIVASCVWQQFKNECTSTSQCSTMYPGGNDCLNNGGDITGVKGGVCGCDNPDPDPDLSTFDVVCGCLGFVPPGFASNIQFPHGMTVTGRQTGDSTSERAILFNSNPGEWTGNDTDLQVNLGNLLIINKDGNFYNPDDNVGGGHLEMNFAVPVEVVSIKYADIEGHESGELIAYDAGGTVLNQGFVAAIDDGTSAERLFPAEGVSKLKLKLRGSGALAEVKICVPAPSSFGDPHFVTWGGDYYDYHGICDLMFLESKSNNLMVQLRTEKKYHYSYISSAAIQLNDDIYEFGSWGQVIANGVYLSQDSELPTTFGGHPMTLTRSNKKDHIYTIDMGDGTGIEVKTYKEMVAVRILGPNEDKFMDARGLMGSPAKNGEKVGRDGAVWTKDLNAFGQEWQVTAEEPTLFQSVREPQAPQRCLLPTEMGSSSELPMRRLGETMARSEAEEACANWKMNKEACIADVMVTGDKDLAKAFYD